MDHCDVVGEGKGEQSAVSRIVIEEIESALEVLFP